MLGLSHSQCLHGPWHTSGAWEMLAEQTGLSSGWISVQLISGLCCDPYSQIKDCSCLHGAPSLEVFNFKINSANSLKWRVPTPAILCLSIFPQLICTQECRIKLSAPAPCLKVKNKTWNCIHQWRWGWRKDHFMEFDVAATEWARHIAIRTSGWVMNPK